MNNVEWVTAEATAADGVLKTMEPAVATFVRVKNKGTSAVNADITAFSVSTSYDAGTVTAEYSTRLGVWSGNGISYAIDGNMKTRYYSSNSTIVGDYVQVNYANAFPLYDLKICYAVNPKGIAEGVDGFAATKLEVSSDGTNWEQIGNIIEDENYVVETIDGQQVASVKFNAQGKVVKNIRFSAAEASDNWIQVYEVLCNLNPVALVESSFDIYDTTNLYDLDFNTFVSADSIQEGDYLTYKLTAYTDIESLTIMQDEDQICGAAVSVKKADGSWAEIGTLDERMTMLPVNGIITEVKLEFDPEKPGAKDL